MAFSLDESSLEMQPSLALAIELYRGGKYSAAAVICRELLSIDASMPAVLHLLGLSQIRTGAAREAVELIARAIELEPAAPDYHVDLAEAHRACGDSLPAVECCERALRLNSQNPAAYNTLGLAHLDLQQPEEAAKAFRKAIELRANFAAAHNNLGAALLATGASGAADHFRKAIELSPSFAPAHGNLGRWLRDHDRPREAIACLAAAAELDAHNAVYWEDLANLHWEAEMVLAAIACWERALAIDPNRPDARNSLGWALHVDGRLAEAAVCYRTALRLAPDFAPAHVNSGVLLEEQGNLAGAETAYREAIRCQPRYALALARLATLLRGKITDADQHSIDECLSNGQLADRPRARLLFGLAHVADARGDLARAADCLHSANAISLQENQRCGRVYDPAAHDRFVDGVIEGFSAAWFTRTAGIGSPTRRPIFIFGLPRSGTTLIEQILASHPLVHGAGELVLGSRGFELIPRYLGRNEAPSQCLAHVDASTVRRMAEQHLVLLNRLAPERVERIVDKMPDNYLYLGWLATLFPSALFIHCCRDLRDVALSCWMTDFRAVHWANHFEHIVARFRSYQRMMHHWNSVCPAPVLEVRYEETVAEPERVARRLVKACGQDWRPECLEFHRTERTVRTASVTQVRQPIYRSSVGRWKRYEGQLPTLLSALSD
ncbi:MAG TPA: sulfotransferase [Urbifossiella sp.]|nr:sulfotransferase [Urbifossiella sp.]